LCRPTTGIAERGDLISGTSNRWQQTIDVDLTAVSGRLCLLFDGNQTVMGLRKHDVA